MQVQILPVEHYTKMKKIQIIGGGTVQYISNHFAICAPAYGKTAKVIEDIFRETHQLSRYNPYHFSHSMVVYRLLTRMADPNSRVETNQDVADWVDNIKKDLETKIVFFNVAMCDYKPYMLKGGPYSITRTYENLDKYAPRLETSVNPDIEIYLSAADKVIGEIRKGRKDIFLVGFKATCGATKQQMFTKGLNLLKQASCNLVLVNDTLTNFNMIVTPEETTYGEAGNRQDALVELCEMAIKRSQLTFTQSTVVDGQLVPWDSQEIPQGLRTIVNYCIEKNAYKPFNGATVGHFACKLTDTEFLTSIRKSNFNDLAKNGLVRIKTDGPDTVLAYGAKPSVGGQSQRIVFNDHKGMDCIVHFHCPLKPWTPDVISVRSQKEYECGSHECGKNTSDGLLQTGNLKAVMLDKHGPNIVFNKNINPQEVIDFIERNFDLDKKTGGYEVK